MTRLPPSPFISISSVTSEVAAICGVSVAAAGAVVPPSASAVSNSESAAPIPARESAPNSAGADLQIPAPAAFSIGGFPWECFDTCKTPGDCVVEGCKSSSCGGVERTRSEGSSAIERWHRPEVTGCKSRVVADETSSAGIKPGPHDSISDTQYIPELFSVYAARRCKDLISPPLPKVERNIDGLALRAVENALNLHPRDLDNDPLPAFLRSPVFAPEPTRGIVESLLKLARLSA
jgi:hypothetical protein